MMTMDHRWHYLDSLRSAMSLVIYPLQSLVDLSTAPLRMAGQSLQSRSALQKQVEELRIRETLLNAQLQRLVALEAENRRLRQLLHTSRETVEETRVAEIVAVDLDPFSRRIVIDKGSRDDIFPGQPILDASGIMGQVIRVEPLSSTAMLLTDPGHAIPVQVNRNGLRAVAVGTGASNRLDVPFIPNNADIRKGDVLISSGLGGRFPPGHPVATVIRVESDPARPYAVVEAAPAAQLDKIREVLLVWTNPQREHPLPLPAAGEEPATAETGQQR